MEHSTFFYLIMGASVVLVPAITDRLLKGRVTVGWRLALVLLAAALTGVILVLIARLLAL
jgi:hypothetical protein